MESVLVPEKAGRDISAVAEGLGLAEDLDSNLILTMKFAIPVYYPTGVQLNGETCSSAKSIGVPILLQCATHVQV